MVFVPDAFAAVFFAVVVFLAAVFFPVVFAAVWHLAWLATPVYAVGYGFVLIHQFLPAAVLINLSLAFFNLIPLPPLDGSSILVPFLRGSALETYYRMQQYALPILIIVLYLLPQILRIDLVGIYFRFTVYPLFNLLAGIALG